MSIRGITFDLWDTLVHDDSDEIDRREQGLPSKREERRQLVWEAVRQERSLEQVTLAYDVADAAFNKVWKEHHITWPIEERLEIVLRGLGLQAPAGWDEVLERTRRMEVDLPPRLIEDCAETLALLAERYPLAIVSDAIVTPGSHLRDLLQNHGIKRFFSSFAFSDEVGHSKPHRDMFVTALEGLGLEPGEVIHLGDRDHNDIKGAQAFGMKAVLFTATRDVDQDTTSADAVCASYAELPQIIDQLSG
jgi:putative hydrolase of the HAD superfamily